MPHWSYHIAYRMFQPLSRLSFMFFYVKFIRSFMQWLNITLREINFGQFSIRWKLFAFCQFIIIDWILEFQALNNWNRKYNKWPIFKIYGYTIQKPAFTHLTHSIRIVWNSTNFFFFCSSSWNQMTKHMNGQWSEIDRSEAKILSTEVFDIECCE